MKEILIALIGGFGTVFAAWISSKRKRRPNEPVEVAALDRPARYVGAFAAGTVVVFACLLALREQGVVHGVGLGDNFPVGTVIAYMGNSAPDGWLLCDGRSVGDTHIALKSLIGEKTPDLKGRFLRGLDSTGTIDPDGKTRALGSPQEDELKNHQHTYTFWEHVDAKGGKSGAGSPDVAGTPATGISENPKNGGGPETRPLSSTLGS